jgi:hypothetical protein
MLHKLRVNFLLFGHELYLRSDLRGLLGGLEVWTTPLGAILGGRFFFGVLLKVFNDFVLSSNAILDLEALNSFKSKLLGRLLHYVVI